MADIFEGGSELDRVLRGTFKSVSKKEAEHLLSGLGDYDSAAAISTQKTPGLTYQGGPQSAGGGGIVARRVQDKLDALFAGIDRTKCPTWLTVECCEVLSRCLETTFRNFQLTSRLPSHISPPFPAQLIEEASDVDIPGAPYGGASSFVKVVCFKIPAFAYRGEIKGASQALENAAAWLDVEWRITVDGSPYHPFERFIGQRWLSVPGSDLCAPIHLVSNQTICLEARSLSMASHHAFADLCGWFYPVRSETGPEIRSTLVD